MDNNSACIARDCETANYYYEFNEKLMLISLLVLVAICIIVAFFHLYARWVHQQRRNRQLLLDDYLRRHGAQRADYLVFNFGPTVIDNGAPRKGLERSVLKSLPTFFYDSAAHNPPLECAVCLSEFGDHDLGRLLPKCNHCFHVDCIDMWFCSHSDCPLCRAPVKPIEKPDETQTSVLEAGSSSGLPSIYQRNEDQVGSSSSSLPSGDRTKPPELVGITVEIPTTNPDSGDPGSESGKGVEDPGGRVSCMTTKKGADDLCKS